MDKNEFLVLLGNYIRKEKVKLFKSNLDFADACDVDEKTIRRILVGKQNISLGIFIKLCKAIDKKPSEVMNEIGI